MISQNSIDSVYLVIKHIRKYSWLCQFTGAFLVDESIAMWQPRLNVILPSAGQIADPGTLKMTPLNREQVHFFEENC